MAEFKNLITLTQVFDGAPGEPGAPGKDSQKYYIETNYEEILKFKEYGENDEGNKIEIPIFSPSTLSFRIYENPKQVDSEQIELTYDNFSLEIQEDNIFKEISGDFLTLGQVAEEEQALQNTVYFDIEEYSTKVKTSYFK